MLQFIVPIAATLGAGYLFIVRGKAHIGDTVEVLWKPGGTFGEQGVFVQGKVVSKTNPIVGPYYGVQLFQLPKIPALENMVNPDIKPIVPSTLEGLRDSDIVRNLSRTK